MLELFSSQNVSEKSLTLDVKPLSRRGNVVYGSHKQIYEDIFIERTIAKAKFSIYLVKSRITKLDYAMKVFPYKNGKPTLNFNNEKRFVSLSHPNIVKYLFFENQREVMLDNMPSQISYTIMEYARNGNFLSFLSNFNKAIDEKLARTYFKQLINGLEYLHQTGIAHMDLKLDNLLLTQDFALKIADFDLAHYQDDAIIISNGTKCFRAPEVVLGRCNNTKTADIFSAGIILFTLKAKGVLPQFENDLINSINFADLLYNDTEKFWDYHSKIHKQTQVSFDEDFKSLFVAMTKLNPKERASIEEIKSSKWYNGPCYGEKELKEKMENLFLYQNIILPL